MDKVLIGVNHFFDHPTTNYVYKTGPFEPEGLLSKKLFYLKVFFILTVYFFVLGSLTAIFHVILGIQMGQILREYKETKSRLVRWLVWAVILGLLGSELHFSNVIPVNKSLW